MSMLVFLSKTLYALCIETKIFFVNQNKGKITIKIFPWASSLLRSSYAIDKICGVELTHPLLESRGSVVRNIFF